MRLKSLATPAEVIWKSNAGVTDDTSSVDWWLDTPVHLMTSVAVEDLSFTEDAPTFTSRNLSGAGAFTLKSLE